MRRKGDDRDPPRWRQTWGTDATQAGKSIASDVRALPAPTELDDVQLAQIRQRIVQGEASRLRGAGPAAWSWIRTTAFALGFLILGGLTTAMGARLYLRRLERSAAVSGKSGHDTAGVLPREKSRRWRMAVREAAELELSFDTNGAEIAVVDGRAEITGPQLADPIFLTPGSSWRAGAIASETAQPAPTPTPTPAPALPTARQGDRMVAAVSPVKRSRLASLPDLALSPDLGASVEARTSHRAEIPSPPSPSPSSPSVEPPVFLVAPISPGGRPQTTMAISSPRVTRTPTVLPEAPAEAFLVAGALRSIRIDRFPAEALAKLDEHRRRFPNGVLRREADLARVEALLGLGRKDAALEVLDSLSLTNTASERKVTLARAELRADRGRCAQAIDDLDRLAANPQDDDIAARALFGRARCELWARNLDRARVDLTDYIRRFPAGTKKTEVEALLGRLGGQSRWEVK